MKLKKANLEKIAKIWQLQLNLEYENQSRNVRLSFKDIGAFCEFLTLDFYEGFIGGGSGGMGFDLVNNKTHKGIEVKSCCTIQNAKCTKCGYKFNDLFTSKCPFCGGTDYRMMSDSRFGIDAKEFLNQFQKKLFDSFCCCHIFKIEHDSKNHELSIGMNWYKIDFTNNEIKQHQLKYFENQLNLGRKPHCNLLPNSFDFYKLCPKILNETTILINYKNVDNQPIIKSIDKKEDYIRINADDNAFRASEKVELKKLSSYDSKSNTVSCIDFTKNIDYRNKTLGKERGDTRTNIYNRV